jgi:ribosome-associated protein
MRERSISTKSATAPRATSKKPAKTAPSKSGVATPPKKVAAPKKSAKISALDALCATIVTALDDNKAEDISCLSLLGKCSFADAMIVASGRSARHVAALSDHVSEALKKQGMLVSGVEGKETGDWILMDVGDVVVHLFRPEVRQFYNLEKMWSAPVVEN